MGILLARILEWVATSPGDLPDPGIKPRSPALQADSLPAELPGKPIRYNTGAQINYVPIGHGLGFYLECICIIFFKR